MNPVKTALSLAALSLLLACSEAPAPAPVVPQPILQKNQLRFPAGHPQLALIGVTEGRAAQPIAVDLPAKLVWNEERTQRIYPAFAGRVIHIRADVGQAVKSGSVLADLASPEFGMAQSETARAQVDARLAQKSLARQRELFEAGIIPRKDLEQAEADAARSQAEVSRATARTTLYGNAEAVNQQLSLRASLSGVVVERNVNPGQELRPDQSGPGVPAIFVLTDPTSLWVQIDARESEAGVLRPGASFELTSPSFPGEKFTGKVVVASDAIDPSTRTIKVRGMVPNPDRRLKAEMLATARVFRPFASGTVVPAQAVVLRGAEDWVFVEVSPGVFEPREVELAYQGSREVVISKGLAVGERIVSENTLLLARQFRMAQDDAKTPPAAAVPAKAASK